MESKCVKVWDRIRHNEPMLRLSKRSASMAEWPVELSPFSPLA